MRGGDEHRDFWDKDGNPVSLTVIGGRPPHEDPDPSRTDMTGQGKQPDPQRQGGGSNDVSVRVPPPVPSVAAESVNVFTEAFARQMMISPKGQAVVWKTAVVTDNRLILDVPEGFGASSVGDVTFVIGTGGD